MSNVCIFLASALLQSKRCCETHLLPLHVSLLSFLSIKYVLNKETSAEILQQRTPNQAMINISIWGVQGGGGYQRSLWQMGAKSLELQIRIGRNFRETSTWPQHWENVLQYRQRQHLQESTYWSIMVQKGHLGKKGNATSKSIQQMYGTSSWSHTEICGVWSSQLQLNYPLVQEWLVLCVEALRSRAFISVSFCLYLGRIQSKSSHAAKRLFGTLNRSFPSLTWRCCLDALQKRRTWPLLLTDVLNAFQYRSNSLYTNSSITPVHAVLLGYAISPLKTIFIC